MATGPNIDSIALVHLGDEAMADYGRLRGWMSASYALGCLVFGAILQLAGVDWAMPIYAVASLVVLAWSTTIVRDRPKDVEAHGRLGTVGAVFREAPRFWGFLAAALLVWVGFNAAWNFIALKIVSEGGGPFLIGIGTALGGTARGAGDADLVPPPGTEGICAWCTCSGCCIYAAGFLMWGLIDDPTIVSLLTMLEGVAFGLIFTTSVVVVGRLMPPTLYSTANSMREMVMLGIAPILGAGIGGFVYQHAGTRRALRRRVLPGAGGSGRGMVRLVHTRAVRTRCAGSGDRTRHHVTEADEHRAFVERRWPELGVRTFEPVGDGWDCFTYW